MHKLKIEVIRVMHPTCGW